MSKQLMQIAKRPKIEVISISEVGGSSEIIQICESLMRNRIFLNKKYPIVTLPLKKLWVSDPLGDRSWLFLLNTLVIAEFLIKGYEVTKQHKYIDKALEILWEWKKENFPNSDYEMAWHDHSTALRAVVISNLFEVWRTNFPWDEKIFDKFNQLIEAHCEKLADKEFYMEKHNHGLDQDVGLFVTSTVFSHLNFSSAWKELSLKRFWVQVNHLFAEDGSYLEHSPHYSYLITDRLVMFSRFVKSHDKGSYEKLKSIIEKSINYLTHIVQPNGMIPSIGDSDVVRPAIHKWNGLEEENFFQEFQYSLSNGKEGKKPDKLDWIFPNGGFATFRNKWEFDESTVQLAFYGGFHSRVHKHHDDLSFTLFALGIPLFIDAGKYNYNYNTDERQYVVSGYGHNSVVIDGKNSDIKRLNIGKSGIVSYSVLKDISVVMGKHCLYDGIIHNRILLFIKPNNIFVFDWFNDHKIHKYEQIFNINQNVKCKVTGNNMVTCIYDNKALSVKSIYKSEELKTSLYNGEKNPLRGWSSLKFNEFVPNNQISFKMSGSNVKMATQINLTNSESETFFSWEKDLIHLKLEYIDIKLVIGQDNVYVTRNDLLIPTNHVSNNTLNSAIDDWKHFEFREKYRQERNRRLRYQEQAEKLSDEDKGKE